MDETWTDPQYADLVAAYDRLRNGQNGPARPCPSCQHGLGALLMVDLTTKKPIITLCPVCSV